MRSIIVWKQYEVPAEIVSQVHARPPKPPIEQKPAETPTAESGPANAAKPGPADVPTTSA